jgi:undecaprenyl-diphosphatase
LVADDWAIFAAGFGVAFVTALIVVKAFITFLQRHSFAVFAYYRVAFGTAVLVVGKYF